MSDVELKIDGLDKILKALKKPPTIKVGILGKGTARQGSGKSNAEIGAIHEFGAPAANIPQRSFLRIPLIDNLGKRIEAAGALDKDVVAEMVRSGTLLPWAKMIAVIAEGIVQEAFTNGGYGRWKPSNMAKKKVQMTLVETQQLRNSITSEVKE